MSSSVVTVLSQVSSMIGIEVAIFGSALIALAIIAYYFNYSVISVLNFVARFGQSKYNKLLGYVDDVKDSLVIERCGETWSLASRQGISPKNLLQHSSICGGLSFIGGLIGGPIGLAIGGLIGGLSSFHLARLQSGSTLGSPIDIISSYNPAKKLNLMKFGIITAGISFLCFMFGGHPSVAIGGLLGELLAYLTFNQQNVYEMCNEIGELPQQMLTKIEPVLSSVNIFEVAKTAALSFGSLALSLLAKTHINWNLVYEKIMNAIEKLIELLNCPQFRKNVIIFTTIAVVTYVVYKWSRDTDLIHQIRQSILNCNDSSIESIKSTYLKLWSYLKTLISLVVDKLENLTQKQQQQLDKSLQQSTLSEDRRQEPVQVAPTKAPTSFSVIQFFRTNYMNFIDKMKCDVQFSENVTTCACLAFMGLLFGGWIGFIFGAISGVVIALGLSSTTACTTESKPTIRLNAFSNEDQTQWYNFFGSMYKLDVPKQDIPRIQKWMKDKKSPNFNTFLSYVMTDLKFKVTEMHVKFEGSDNPNQDQIIQPINLIDASGSETVTQDNSTDQMNGSKSSEEEYEDAREQNKEVQTIDDDDSLTSPQNILELKREFDKDPRRISMVF